MNSSRSRGFDHDRPRTTRCRAIEYNYVVPRTTSSPCRHRAHVPAPTLKVNLEVAPLGIKYDPRSPPPAYRLVPWRRCGTLRAVRTVAGAPCVYGQRWVPDLVTSNLRASFRLRPAFR